MKKMFILSLMSLLAIGMNAQEQPNREAQCKQRIEQRANKLAAEMGLNDANKGKFVELYKNYAKALHEANAPLRETKCQLQRKDCKALTDAEARECLNKKMARAELRIKAAQKRLDINKKYASEFQKVLTPQQTLRVMKTGHKGKHGKRQQCQQGGRRQMQHGKMCSKQGQQCKMQGHAPRHGQMQHHPMQRCPKDVRPQVCPEKCDTPQTCPKQ